MNRYMTGWREIASSGVGAAAGTLLAPAGHGPVGGCLGAGIGFVIVWLVTARGPLRLTPSRADTLAMYSLVGLNLLMIGGAFLYWHRHPHQWLIVLLAASAFGSCVPLLLLTWIRQNIPASNAASLRRNLAATGAWGLVLAATMLLFIPLGEYLIALVGFSVFGGLAAVALWRGYTGAWPRE